MGADKGVKGIGAEELDQKGVVQRSTWHSLGRVEKSQWVEQSWRQEDRRVVLVSRVAGSSLRAGPQLLRGQSGQEQGRHWMPWQAGGGLPQD